MEATTCIFLIVNFFRPTIELQYLNKGARGLGSLLLFMPTVCQLLYVISSWDKHRKRSETKQSKTKPPFVRHSERNVKHPLLFVADAIYMACMVEDDRERERNTTYSISKNNEQKKQKVKRKLKSRVSKANQHTYITHTWRKKIATLSLSV